MKTIVGVVVALSFLNVRCSCSSNSPDSYSNSAAEYNGGYEYGAAEPENPFEDGSGHSAGYEWAERNQVSSCGGNSQSFIDGCEEWLRQQEEPEYDDPSDYGY
ncbi:hypothetical protein ACES2I_08775 [Bdellovibrio bacteriovorus]|uniref:hypothetical protein n=1 Tax=Bdellovibrio bacteriovorus TaxID=959 RepID=UPI0035A5F62F